MGGDGGGRGVGLAAELLEHHQMGKEYRLTRRECFWNLERREKIKFVIINFMG